MSLVELFFAFLVSAVMMGLGLFALALTFGTHII